MTKIYQDVKNNMSLEEVKEKYNLANRKNKINRIARRIK